MDRKWRCKLGLHRWLYEGWQSNPWECVPFAFNWRGCKDCKKSQYEHHPAGYGALYRVWLDVTDYDVLIARYGYWAVHNANAQLKGF